MSEALDAYEPISRAAAPIANAQRVRKHMTAALATKPVAMLSAHDLRRWRDELVAKGVKPATINRTRAGLRAALELAATLDHRIANRDAVPAGAQGPARRQQCPPRGPP